MTTLPDGIFTTLDLYQSWLDLSKNSLRTLPDTIFRRLTVYLGGIYLQENKLTTLPDTIFNHSDLGLLSVLDISHNKMHFLPDDLFASLTRTMGSIAFAKNGLIKLPERFFTSLTFFALGTVDLSYNDLSYLPDDVFKSVQFVFESVINLEHNGLVRIWVRLFPLVKSNNFNPLSALFQPFGLEDMQGVGIGGLTIVLGYNNLTELHEDAFTYVGNLIMVKVDHNYLVTLPERIFNIAKYLQILDLSYYKLKTLPSGIFSVLSQLDS